MEKPSHCKAVIFVSLVLAWLLPAVYGTAQPMPDFLARLSTCYRSAFTILDNNTIKWNDGEVQILDDGIKRSPEEMIESGDIEDQFAQPYIPGPLNSPPATDPGRVRNTLFFKKLYGSTPAEVQKNMKVLAWMPAHTNTSLLFNTQHGAWDSLKRVSDELEALDPEFLKYVTVTAGTYNWRVIKDTDRLSAHSFGIAIDINVQYSSYWSWDAEYRYRNQIPYEIVKIFEKNGFIWGGKWYHYDTMHFEYRPELF